MKSCTFRKLALYFDLAAVFLNDSMNNGESQAGPVIFGGKKRIEHVWHVLGFNPNAVVLH